MDDVKVKTSELLAKMQENRDKHAQLYKDAVEGYKVEATKKLNKALTAVEKGDLVGSVSLKIPKDHTEEYDEIIEMLKMTVDNEIVLRKHEFNNYVLDKWISTEEKSFMRTMALSSSNFANYK